MQENKFEKKVQQTMEGLQLKPSDAIWQNVATSISQKKRNKSFFWILCTLIFIIIAGIINWNYFINQQVKITNAVKHIDTSKQSTTARVFIQPANSIIVSVKDSILQNRRVVDLEKSSNRKGLQSIYHSKLLLLLNSKSVVKSQENFNAVNTNIEKSSNQLSKKVKVNSKGKKYIQISNVAIDSLVGEANGKGLPAITATLPAGNFYKKYPLLEANISTEVFSNVPRIKGNLIKDSATEKNIQQRTVYKNKKITLGLSFLLGRGATGQNYLSNIANRSYYAQYSNNLTGTGSAYSNFEPSLVQPGLSFQIGINASKNISRRSSIGIGLQYQQLSTRIKTALPVLDAQGARIPANDSINYYLNRYHFLQFNVNFLTRLSNFNKHNLFFNTGLSVSQLIQTNSPQFNNVTGQYFIDNTFFNKTVAGFYADIDINISISNTAPLLLGPSLYYSFTPMASKGLYVNSRYSFLGIRLLKKFGKK